MRFLLIRRVSEPFCFEAAPGAPVLALENLYILLNNFCIINNMSTIKLVTRVNIVTSLFFALKTVKRYQKRFCAIPVQYACIMKLKLRLEPEPGQSAVSGSS